MSVQNNGKELTLERADQTVRMKYQRLFNEKELYYRGMEAYNIRTNKRVTVSAILLNGVEVVDSEGIKTQVKTTDLFPLEIYNIIDGNLVIAQIFYKGKGTPAVLVSEATLGLACRRLIEDYPHMFCKPDRDLLRGKNRERFYDHLRRSLIHLAWNDMSLSEINSMSEDDLSTLYAGENFTIEAVLERLLETYKVEPCETCTVPITCDCRMRIVQQVRGDNAASYKAAQHAMREYSEPIAFWLKGIFRGRPRVRWMDYDVYLQESLDKDFSPKGVKKLLKSIRVYEQWSGRSIGEEVMTTIQEAVKKLGYTSLDELES